MENDTNERQQLCDACRGGNWVIQIDSDEVLANPGEFSQWMSNADPNKNVRGELVVIYKILDAHALVVDRDRTAYVRVGSKQGTVLTQCRETALPVQDSNLTLIHNTWGRTAKELRQKFENWGHSKEIDARRYVKMWENVNVHNYQDFSNLHPLSGPLWPRLKLIALDQLHLSAFHPPRSPFHDR